MFVVSIHEDVQSGLLLSLLTVTELWSQGLVRVVCVWCRMCSGQGSVCVVQDVQWSRLTDVVHAVKIYSSLLTD